MVVASIVVAMAADLTDIRRLVVVVNAVHEVKKTSPINRCLNNIISCPRTLIPTRPPKNCRKSLI